MHSFCILKKHLQPEAIPYILSKLTTELYPGNLSLTHFYIQDTREDNMAYLLLLLIRTSVCIDVFTGCMPPKTAWDRAQRRSECELNFIPQSRVLKQWKKDQEIDTSSRVHSFSHLSKWRQKNGARTERTWYLIGKAADRCLLKVGHSDGVKKSVTDYQTDFLYHAMSTFPVSWLVTWVSHDFASRCARFSNTT